MTETSKKPKITREELIILFLLFFSYIFADIAIAIFKRLQIILSPSMYDITLGSSVGILLYLSIRFLIIKYSEYRTRWEEMKKKNP